MKKLLLSMVSVCLGLFNGAGAGKPIDAAVGKKRKFAGPASPLNINKAGQLGKGAKGNNQPNDARKKLTGVQKGGGRVNKAATKTAGKDANKIMPRSNPKSGVANKNTRKRG